MSQEFWHVTHGIFIVQKYWFIVNRILLKLYIFSNAITEKITSIQKVKDFFKYISPEYVWDIFDYDAYIKHSPYNFV